MIEVTASFAASHPFFALACSSIKVLDVVCPGISPIAAAPCPEMELRRLLPCPGLSPIAAAPCPEMELRRLPPCPGLSPIAAAPCPEMELRRLPPCGLCVSSEPRVPESAPLCPGISATAAGAFPEKEKRRPLVVREPSGFTCAPQAEEEA